MATKQRITTEVAEDTEEKQKRLEGCFVFVDMQSSVSSVTSVVDVVPLF